MDEVQKNENGTTVPQADGKPKKEDKPKRELTPQQVQQRRKMIVFPLMFLAFAGQKAGGYPPDVLLFRRLVYLHHRFINLQYRETGRQAAANRTYQTTAIAGQ